MLPTFEAECFLRLRHFFATSANRYTRSRRSQVQLFSFSVTSFNQLPILASLVELKYLSNTTECQVRSDQQSVDSVCAAGLDRCHITD